MVVDAKSIRRRARFRLAPRITDAYGFEAHEVRAAMDEITAIERVLRRDRLVVCGGLLVIVVLAWIFVLGGAGTGMSVGAMTTWQFPPPVTPLANEHWPTQYWLMMLLMWWAMMVAMMTPSAAPIVLLYARVVRRAQQHGKITRAVVSIAWFVIGYLYV